MKQLLLITFLFIGSIAYSQTSDSTKTVYCELVGTQKFLSLKVTVQVDYGQGITGWKDTRMRDESTGKVQTFNSMVDALNYMGSLGWEFAQAYVVTTDGQSVYHWLLKKKQ